MDNLIQVGFRHRIKRSVFVMICINDKRLWCWDKCEIDPVLKGRKKEFPNALSGNRFDRPAVSKIEDCG